MRVDIVYFEGGSGHRTAAWALQHQLQQEHPAWETRCVDIQEIFDLRPGLLGIPFRIGVAGLNRCMRRESYWGFTPLCWAAIGWCRLMNWFNFTRSFIASGLAKYWKDAPPDFVISTTPLMHPFVFHGARLANTDVICITIPVDHEEMCAGYWHYPNVDQLYFHGTQRLTQQALQVGVDAAQITKVSGMLIDPRFYVPRQFHDDAELIALGLDPSLKTVLVHFGGQGTVNVLKIAQSFSERKTPINLICLCGKNDELHAQCEAVTSSYPILALRHLDGPPVLQLQIADVLVGKPGTLTLNEALISRTQFVFVKSTGLSPIQKGNEDWMLERGVGNIAHTVDDVVDVVTLVLDNENYATTAELHRHTGIYDIVEEIEKLAQQKMVA